MLEIVGVSGYFIIIVTLIQLCAFVDLNYSNCIVMHVIEITKKVTEF